MPTPRQIEVIKAFAVTGHVAVAVAARLLCSLKGVKHSPPGCEGSVGEGFVLEMVEWRRGYGA